MFFNSEEIYGKAEYNLFFIWILFKACVPNTQIIQMWILEGLKFWGYESLSDTQQSTINFQ